MTEEVLYLDVRTPAEWAERHVVPSLNIPVDELPRRVSELGARHRHIVVFCRSGRRSALAKLMLAEAGYSHVDDGGSIDSVAQRARTEGTRS